MKGFIGFFIAIVVLSFALTIAYYQTDEVATFTVTGKERIVEVLGSGEDASISSKYLVFTDVETFENTDMLFAGKFNSSDVQGKLIEGKTYSATVYGWRIPWMSMYRNIGKNVTEVDVDQQFAEQWHDAIVQHFKLK